MQRMELLLIFLILIATATTVYHSATENSFTFAIHGPAEVFLVYPNGTKIQVDNGTYSFTGIMGVYIQAPQGYDLYVNGLEIPSYYMRYFNSSATFIIYAIPEYDTLTINLNGSGTAVLHFLNGTEEELTSSTSFKVLNTTYVWITSTTPFMIDRDTMVTHYFGENITANTTWNVIFNPPTPQGYVNITVILYNPGIVNMTVYNVTLFPYLETYLTLVTLNHTESFLVPKGYRIAFYSYTCDFTVNDQKAFYMLKGGYYYYYFGTAKYNNKIIIVFTQTKTTSTTSTTTTTITKPPATSSSAITTTTQSKPSGKNSAFIVYAAIGTMLLVSAIYIAIKGFRK